MKIRQVSERLVMVEQLPVAPYAYAKALQERLAGLVTDVVAAKFAVGVYFQDPVELPSLSQEDLFTVSLPPEMNPLGTLLSIPVCYGRGPDLAEAAERLAISVEKLVELHTSREVTCFAVGFCPGFAYCEGIDPKLCGLERLPAPRVRVEPGMVGLTGNMTAIYPLPRPGGWRLIGQTPLILCDPANDYFPIATGQRIRYSAIGEGEFEKLKGKRLEEIN